MSHIAPAIRRQRRSLAGLTLIAALSLQAGAASARQPDPREFQAFGYHFQIGDEHGQQCRRANGAEILGGFYGADDFVNSETGEICPR